MASQQVLMYAFFGSESKSQDIIAYLTGSDEHQPNTDECRFHVVTCTDCTITALEYAKLQVGKFSLPYVPSTVESLTIIDCLQQYKVRTRMLPREARSINLRANFIYGKIDLRTLPLKLCVLNLSHNQITKISPVDRLPPFLERILLQGNDIRQDTIYVGEVPASVTLISLRGENMKIQKMESLFPEKGISDKARSAIKMQNISLDRISLYKGYAV